nr:hypothetical protein [Tanacetum cinerariifolium]
RRWGGEGDALMLVRWFRRAAVGVAMVERRRLRWCVGGGDVMEVVAACSGGDALMLVMWFRRAAVGVAMVERRRLRWCVGGGDVMEVVAACSGGAWRDGDEGDDGKWRPKC